MTLVLDSGALIALERNDRAMWRRFKAALSSAIVPLSHGGIVGQAWRGSGPRQASLARALASVQVQPLDDPAGRAAGELLARTKQADVIDAALVLLAEDGDQIVTSDPDDLDALIRAAGRDVEVIRA